MSNYRMWALAGAISAAACCGAAAQPVHPSQNGNTAPFEVAQATASPRPGVVFSASEKNLIRRLLGAAGVTTTEADDGGRKKKKSKGHGRGKGLPPGLAKRDTLPPGLARQLAKNGKLPPGLDKRHLPADIESRLPKTAKGTERLIVGKDVVLVDKDTQTVLDIVRDVIDVITPR